MCPRTLLVRSGWDFHRVRQRTDNQRLIVGGHHGVADKTTEKTLQPIRILQTGLGGNVDVDLKEEGRGRGGEINGDAEGGRSAAKSRVN